MKYKHLIIALLVVISCSWLEAYAGFSGGGSRSVSVSRSPSPSVSRPATTTVARSTAGQSVATATTQQKAMSLYDTKTAPTVTPTASVSQPTRPSTYTPSAYTSTPSPSVASNHTTVINNTTVVHQNTGGSGLGTGLVVGAVAGALIADNGRHDTVYVQQSSPPVQYTQPVQPERSSYTPVPDTRTDDVKSSFSWMVLFLVIIAAVILAVIVSTRYPKR